MGIAASYASPELTYQEFRELPTPVRREFTQALSADEFIAFTSALVHFYEHGSAQLNAMTLDQILAKGEEMTGDLVI